MAASDIDTQEGSRYDPINVYTGMFVTAKRAKKVEEHGGTINVPKGTVGRIDEVVSAKLSDVTFVRDRKKVQGAIKCVVTWTLGCFKVQTTE